MNKILYNIVIVNIFFDLFSFWTPNKGLFGILRGVVILTLVAYFIKVYGLPKRAPNYVIYIFVIYVILLFPFVTVPFESIRITFQVLFSLIFYSIGYVIIYDRYRLKTLNKSIFYGVIILLINFVISNVFGLGNFQYDDDSASLYLGNFTNSINLFVYTLIIIPLISFDLPKTKIKYAYLLATFLIFIVVLSSKRVALLTTIIASLILLYNLKSILGIVFKRFSILLIIVAAISPIYIDSVISRWSVRAESGRLEVDSYQSERRFLETLVIWDEMLSFDKPLKSIFGHESFNSPGLYGGGSFGSRQIHIDYNLILSTTGILGLILYSLIYYFIYKEFNKYTVKTKYLSIYDKIIFSTFYMLLIGSLVTSLSGQMYSVTFRTIIFLYLGGLTGYNKKLVLSKQKHYLQ